MCESVVKIYPYFAIRMRKKFKEATKSEEAAFKFLQLHGTIRKSSMKCLVPECPQMMRYMRYKKLSYCAWRCKYHPSRKVFHRTGSFWLFSSQTYVNLVSFVFLWAQQTNVGKAMKYLKLSEVSVIRMYKKFRKICSWWLENYAQPLGGLGVQVQVKEFILRKRPRNRSKPELWALACYSPSEEVGYMCILPDRAETAIHKILKEHIVGGSVICHDKEEHFVNVDQIDIHPPYFQNVIERTIEGLIDPKTGKSSEISDVEQYILDMKKKLFTEMAGTQDHLLPGYLAEFQWRTIHGKNDYQALFRILQHISMRYVTP